MSLRNKKHSVCYMFCSQVLAIIVISSTATVVITVKEPELSSMRWAMPGTRATSFPAGQRQTQALTRRHVYSFWLGTAEKLNAVNSLQVSSIEMKSTGRSEEREAMGCAILAGFLDKEGF